MNLQPKQFWYHSSNANLTPGKDLILPANEVGKSNYDYDYWDEPDGSHRGDYTFAADTEEEAEAWRPTSSGRPVTYVVSPAEGTDVDFEDEHYITDPNERSTRSYLTGDGWDPAGLHAKVRGPMDIHDRIDIPMPNHAGQVVQGTLPPQNWGHFNALPEGYTGPATVGEQFPERDNFRRINPAGERTRSEWAEDKAHKDAVLQRHDYESAWKRAGQQELDL